MNAVDTDTRILCPACHSERVWMSEFMPPFCACLDCAEHWFEDERESVPFETEPCPGDSHGVGHVWHVTTMGGLIVEECLNCGQKEAF